MQANMLNRLTIIAVIILSFFSLGAHEDSGSFEKDLPFVSVNFLVFGPSPHTVTEERLETLRNLKVGPRSAVTTITIPIVEEDNGQYDLIRQRLSLFPFQIFTTTCMSSDKDITSLNEEIGEAGVFFLKERILITKKLGGKVMCGALLFPELESPEHSKWPLDELGNSLRPPALTELVNKRLRAAVPRMQQVADFAAQHGITVVNEYITHWEICGCNTMSSALAFALEVNRPNFGILTDIAHEVHQGKGPTIYAGELQLAKSAGIPLFFQVSEPGRGEIVNSWLPYDHFFGILQALDLVDCNHPLDIEIFDAIEPNHSLMQLTRDPFVDPMQVLIDAIFHTWHRYERVDAVYRNIPANAISKANAIVNQERQTVYGTVSHQ
jgi:sugar phosphate isomerase/epimerase